MNQASNTMLEAKNEHASALQREIQKLQLLLQEQEFRLLSMERARADLEAQVAEYKTLWDGAAADHSEQNQAMREVRDAIDDAMRTMCSCREFCSATDLVEQRHETTAIAMHQQRLDEILEVCSRLRATGQPEMMESFKAAEREVAGLQRDKASLQRQVEKLGDSFAKLASSIQHLERGFQGQLDELNTMLDVKTERVSALELQLRQREEEWRRREEEQEREVRQKKPGCPSPVRDSKKCMYGSPRRATLSSSNKTPSPDKTRSKLPSTYK